MIIAIVGKAQHGKDTLGKMLADTLFEKSGIKYVLMAYATELKKRVQKDFDMSYEQLWGGGKEIPDHRYKKPMRSESDNEPCWTPREILQEYGQFFRTIDYDFWVKALFAIIDDKEYENVIITDARHPNEAEPVKKHGGIIVRIIRNVKTGVHNQQHISETAMDNYKVDYDIRNFGDLDDLQKTADQLADVILNTKKEIKIIGG